MAALTLLCCLFAAAQTSSDEQEYIRSLKENSRNPIMRITGKAPVNGGFRMEGYWVWGSSVIQGEDGLYHMFVSRIPDSLNFTPSWMCASEIVHAVSETPEGPYRFSDVALGLRGSQYWDGRSVHNPRITRYNGKYYLYYMGSTNPYPDPTPETCLPKSPYEIVGRSNKRIGLAIADSPYGPWKRFDEPILKTEPNTFYSFLTSNPTPVINPDGSVLLMFKARAYDGNGGRTDMKLGVATAPHPEGKYTVGNNKQPIFDTTTMGEAEDPFLWRDENGYHAIFKDMTSRFVPEYMGGFLAHSKDGINWTVEEDPQAYSRVIEWDNGTVERLHKVERPFILFDSEGHMTHLFFAVMRGWNDERKSPGESWNMVIELNQDK